MYQVIIVIHVLLGLGVVGLVLLQQGKGADAGAAFGSASSGSVFGAQGASSFLSRTTAILAALFFCTSLGLAVLNGHQSSDVDLMDTPAVEEINPDVPTIDGLDNISDLGSSVPASTQEFSTEETLTNTVTEIVPAVKENLTNVITETIPEAVDTASEKFDTVIDSDPIEEMQ